MDSKDNTEDISSNSPMNIETSDYQSQICEICDKTFPTLAKLNKHVGNTHKKVKKENTNSKDKCECEICGKYFGTRAD